MFSLFKDIIKNYTLQINATLETYQRAFITIYPSYYIQFRLDPVPVNISLVTQIYPTPITGYVLLHVNFTNLHASQPVFVRIWDVDIPSVSGPMGANKWAVSTGVPGELELFIDSNILGLGWHTVTIRFNKTNHEFLEKNFTVQVRLIYTQIEISGTGNLTGKFRYDPTLDSNLLLEFSYTDDPERPLKLNGTTRGYNPIELIPLADFNISDWREVGGGATLDYSEYHLGLYKIAINMSADVGVWSVIITANRTNYAPANITLQFNVTKADSKINLKRPEVKHLDIYKLGSEEIEIEYLNEFDEPILGATVNLLLENLILLLLSQVASLKNKAPQGTISPLLVPEG